MSFTVYKQLHTPTGVDHCVSAFLTHTEQRQDGLQPSAKAPPDLILIKESLLEIYAVRRSPGPVGSPEIPTLELVADFPLHGIVESVAVLHPRAEARGRQRDALLLAFKEAKLSVVEFDTARWTLRTSSLHAYEGATASCGLVGGPLKPFRAPLVRADPQGKCAVEVLPAGAVAFLEAADTSSILAGDDPLDSTPHQAARIKSSYVMEARLLNLSRIRDVTFLHGYVEPALLVLCETDPTWSARLAIRRDTCKLSVLSLNLETRRHPVLWSADQLPSDAYKVSAVPSPIGGAVVLCATLVLYYKQGASLALVVHPLAFGGDHLQHSSEAGHEEAQIQAGVSAPPLAAAEGAARGDVTCLLDAATAAWLHPDCMFLSSKQGTLLMLTLRMAGGAVSALELARVGSSSLACCCTPVGHSLLFLGSTLGDSLLIGCREKTMLALPSAAGQGAAPAATLEEGPAKKQKLEGGEAASGAGAGAGGAAPRSADDDEDDELYGEGGLSGGPVAEDTAAPASRPAGGDGSAGEGGRVLGERRTYSLHIHDSLYGIGPVRDLTVGGAVDSGSAPGDGPPERSEMILASGHGKNGALSILQGGVFPEVIREVQLPEVGGVWAVHHAMPGTEAATLDGLPLHQYLILTRGPAATMVLKAGDTLQEVTETAEFVADAATLHAGNLFDNARILQVHTRGVTLLAGDVHSQRLSLEEILGTSAAAPDPVPTPVFAVSQDPYVLLRMSDHSLRLLTGDPASRLLAPTPNFPPAEHGEVTAAALYLDGVPAAPQAWDPASERRAGWLCRALGTQAPAGAPPVLCLVAYRSGLLEVYSLPDRVCRFSCPAAHHGPRLLRHVAPAEAAAAAGAEELHVADMRLEAFAAGAMDRPVLLLRLQDGALLAYKAAWEPAPAGQPSLCFVRVQTLPWLTQVLQHPPEGPPRAFQPMTRMEGVRREAPLQGVFVPGPHPLWLVASRGRFRAYSVGGSHLGHPGEEAAKRGIVGITRFHNGNCPHGFIYSTAAGMLAFGAIPDKVVYVGSWPLRRVALKCTPHALAYQAETQCYGCLTSTVQTAKQRKVEAGDGHGQMAATAHAYASLQAGGREALHEVRILSPQTWATEWRLPLQSGEIALCIKAVLLRVGRAVRPGAAAAHRPLLAVGTGFPGGEDVPTRGRVLLLEVTRTSIGGGFAWSGKLLYSEEFKGSTRGPVTAIAGLEGYLLLAIGTKVMLYVWNGSSLEGCAFYDAPIYVVSIATVKNFILLGDVLKSVFFLRFSEDTDPPGGKHLTQLAKDFDHMSICSTQFVLDGKQLHLLAADTSMNLHTFAYDTGSWQGQKLVSKGALFLGSHVTAMLRSRPALAPGSAAAARTNAVFGTTGGAVGCIAPLEENAYRRLQEVGRRLGKALVHTAGLNPEAFRKEQHLPNLPPRHVAPGSMLDGELVWLFPLLELPAQYALAEAVGSTRAQIMANLHDLSLAMAPAGVAMNSSHA